MTINSQEQDRHLVLRIRAGDLNAFRELVDKHKDVSLSLANSILKDQDRAEDVLQEVFLKVFEKIHTFKFQSAFTTWLYRIVVNTSYHAIRRAPDHLDLGSMSHQLPDNSPKPGAEILREKEQKRFITEALQRLKADEALVLRLFYLCELSMKEIREITKFSVAKIKVDLHRGRKNLQTELEKLLGTELKNLL